MDTERFKAQVNEKDVRLGVDAASLRDDFVQKLFFLQAKFPGVGKKTLLLNARRLATAESHADWILLAMLDATARK